MVRLLILDICLGIAEVSRVGIPYAEPPLGDLRLRPPVPKALDVPSFDASDFGLMCYQRVGSFQQCPYTMLDAS